MQITYYGHSCFLIEINGKNILFDPFITPNELASEIDAKSIKADYILLTHGHQDHMADVEEVYKNTGATLVSSFELVSWFGNKGVADGHPMNHGGKKKFEFGTVKMVNAIHSSSLPDGTYAGNPAGFVVQTSEKTFYFAGDTALTLDMQLIGQEFDIDFAFMPIGDNFTMDIHDALKAADFVKTDTIIGMHYDTFPYIRLDHEEVKNVAANAKKDLKLMEIGQTLTL
ncbi:metal-dependent hydrolase [Nafulsella turpanensis]|uniref:metal-dependent hydrolase n=1 Tax=Nafulsella turpanensis TaxID=1265690 RepID=UPI00034B3713|nr:metal-dependent hydrolase [Nafulsella turpanensis]